LRSSTGCTCLLPPSSPRSQEQRKRQAGDGSARVASARGEEEDLLQARKSAKDARSRSTVRTIIAGAALSYSLIFIVLLLLRKQLAQRIAAEKELRICQGNLQSLVEDRTKELSKTNAMLTDEIRERARVEERVRWLSTFPEHNPNPIIEVDPAANITYANESAKNVFPGIESEGVHPFLEDIQSVFNLQKNEGSKKIVKEIKVEERWYHKEFHYIESVDRLRIYYSDITDLKKAEESLLASNRELEQFAYVASHDLQEPLRMVASFTELLERNYRAQFDERGLKYLRFIIDGAFRMQTLIQDLLAFSRVGRFEGKRQQIDCNAIMDDVITDLSEKIKEMNAEVAHGELPALMADKSNISRLFLNLIGNALKFRKKDEPPRVIVTAERKYKEWQFAVSDNGIGIDPKYFDKIFVIFQRLHGKEEYPGSGMGLAICKKIVSNYGGKIWVESVPGQGAKFIFSVPKNLDKNEAGQIIVKGAA